MQPLSLRCMRFVKFNAITLRVMPVLRKDFTESITNAFVQFDELKLRIADRWGYCCYDEQGRLYRLVESEVVEMKYSTVSSRTIVTRPGPEVSIHKTADQ